MTSKTSPAYIVNQLFNGDVVREYAHRTAKAAERRVRQLRGAGAGWGVCVMSNEPDAPSELAGATVWPY